MSFCLFDKCSFNAMLSLLVSTVHRLLWLGFPLLCHINWIHTLNEMKTICFAPFFFFHAIEFAKQPQFILMEMIYVMGEWRMHTMTINIDALTTIKNITSDGKYWARFEFYIKIYNTSTNIKMFYLLLWSTIHLANVANIIQKKKQYVSQ